MELAEANLRLVVSIASVTGAAASRSAISSRRQPRPDAAVDKFEYVSASSSHYATW